MFKKLKWFSYQVIGKLDFRPGSVPKMPQHANRTRCNSCDPQSSLPGGQRRLDLLTWRILFLYWKHMYKTDFFPNLVNLKFVSICTTTAVVWHLLAWLIFIDIIFSPHQFRLRIALRIPVFPGNYLFPSRSILHVFIWLQCRHCFFSSSILV